MFSVRTYARAHHRHTNSPTTYTQTQSHGHSNSHPPTLTQTHTHTRTLDEDVVAAIRALRQYEHANTRTRASARAHTHTPGSSKILLRQKWNTAFSFPFLSSSANFSSANFLVSSSVCGVCVMCGCERICISVFLCPGVFVSVCA